jgi:phosphoglycerol transferase MdoB-like AlkP superfamily enzyme
MVDRSVAAWCGILSGIGLTAEAALFMGSGWSVDAFATLAGAAGAMAEGGHLMRWAVVFGVFNLALLTVFLSGLAEHLGSTSQSLRSAILHVGLVGIAIHAIVPIGFYQAVPVLQVLADDPAGETVWKGWMFMLDATQGAGIFFMGLSMLAAGIGWTSRHSRSPFLAGLAILAGGAGVLAVLGQATPLGPIAGLVGMAGLLLSILFRVLGGIHMLRSGT